MIKIEFQTEYQKIGLPFTWCFENLSRAKRDHCKNSPVLIALCRAYLSWAALDGIQDPNIPSWRVINAESPKSLTSG